MFGERARSSSRRPREIANTRLLHAHAAREHAMAAWDVAKRIESYADPDVAVLAFDVVTSLNCLLTDDRVDHLGRLNDLDQSLNRFKGAIDSMV